MADTTTYQTFRTSAPTNSAVRVLTAEMAAALGGVRLTYDQVIAACVAVASQHRDELTAALRPAS